MLQLYVVGCLEDRRIEVLNPWAPKITNLRPPSLPVFVLLLASLINRMSCVILFRFLVIIPSQELYVVKA